MSTTIDNRVVQMGFDNKEFEKGVSQSLNSLTKFENEINSGKIEKGFSLKTVADGISNVTKMFDPLAGAGMRALMRIADKAIDTGATLVKSLTIDPVSTGLQEYETQINAIQTIMSNTAKNGTTLEEVNAALDELNRYADKTIYNFTEMTRNVGTFTRAGVDLETSVQAIKGMSNAAAALGADATSAAGAMFQLSQGLSTGIIRLEDWRSMENRNMTGPLLEDEIKMVAKKHGVAIDAMIKEEGSFRASLKNNWLSSQIMLEALSHFTGDLSEEELKAAGYTEQEIQHIIKLGEDANNAATKIKTVTQLVGTLQETAQSGWTQSWEILIGDFEEAKMLLTAISDIVSEIINKSSDRRNNFLTQFKELGGRDSIINTMANSAKGLWTIITMLKDAFEGVFKPLSSEQVVGIVKNIENLSSKLIVSGKTAEKLKTIFTGVFSALHIGVTVIKNLGKAFIGVITGLEPLWSGLFNIAVSVAQFITNIDRGIQESGKLTINVETISKKVLGIFNTLKEKISGIGKFITSMGTVIKTGLERVKNFIIPILSGIRDSIAKAFSGISSEEAFQTAGFAGLTVIVLKIASAIKDLIDKIKDGGGLISSIKEIIDGVNETIEGVQKTLETFQTQIKAKILMQIAVAVAVLTGSLILLSGLSGADTFKSLTAIGVAITELIMSMAAIENVITDTKSIQKVSTALIPFSISLLIMAGTIKKIGSLGLDEMVKGLGGIFVLILELMAFLNVVNFDQKGVISTSMSLILLGASLKIFANVIKDIGNIDLKTLGVGLVGLFLTLGEIMIFLNHTDMANFGVGKGLGLITTALSLKIFCSVISSIGQMELGVAVQGLVGLGVALAELGVFIYTMQSTNVLGLGVGLVAVGAALLMVSNALSAMGSLAPEQLGQGLITMGISLTFLALGLYAMQNSIGGAIAMIIAAAALNLLVIPITALGTMPWQSLVQSLLGMAGALIIFGVAGALLTPIAPGILAVSVGIMLLGVAVLAAGVGVLAFASGLMTLVTAMVAFAAAGDIIVQSVPNFVKAVYLAIIGIISGIAENAPAIIHNVEIILLALLELIERITPRIVDVSLNILVEILRALDERAPEITLLVLHILKEVATTIYENVTIVRNVVDLINGVLDAIAKFIADFIIAGKNVIDGFVQGIESMFDIVTTTAKNLAEKVYSAVTDFLKISSPSKRFEYIGQMCGEGLSNGLADSIPEVGASGLLLGSVVGESVKKGVSDSLSDSPLANMFGNNSEMFFSDGVTQGPVKPKNFSLLSMSKEERESTFMDWLRKNYGTDLDSEKSNTPSTDDLLSGLTKSSEETSDAEDDLTDSVNKSSDALKALNTKAINADESLSELDTSALETSYNLDKLSKQLDKFTGSDYLKNFNSDMESIGEQANALKDTTETAAKTISESTKDNFINMRRGYDIWNKAHKNDGYSNVKYTKEAFDEFSNRLFHEYADDENMQKFLAELSPEGWAQMFNTYNRKNQGNLNTKSAMSYVDTTIEDMKKLAEINAEYEQEKTDNAKEVLDSAEADLSKYDEIVDKFMKDGSGLTIVSDETSSRHENTHSRRNDVSAVYGPTKSTDLFGHAKNLVRSTDGKGIISSDYGDVTNRALRITGQTLSLASDILQKRSNNYAANKQAQTDYTNNLRAIQLSVGTLNAEVAAIQNDIKNLKVVLDSGAVVGELANPLDRWLGKKIADAKRGV